MEHKETKTIFRERFDKLREGRSNTEFAEFLGLSRQTVGFYLNGDRLPDAPSLAKIAQRCKVSTDYLLGIVDSSATEPDLARFQDYFGLDVITCETLRTYAELSAPPFTNSGDTFTQAEFIRWILINCPIVFDSFCFAINSYIASTTPDKTEREYRTCTDGKNVIISAREYALLSKDSAKTEFARAVDRLWEKLCSDHNIPYNSAYSYDGVRARMLKELDAILGPAADNKEGVDNGKA